MSSQSYATTVQDALAAIKTNPKNPFNWLDLGNAFVASGDKEKARECYERALAIDPDLPEAADALKALGATPAPATPQTISAPKKPANLMRGVLLTFAILGGAMLLLGGAAVAWAATSSELQTSDVPMVSQFGFAVCKARTGGYVEETDDLLGRWADTYRLAANTSRIALSPLVQRMQDMRSEAAKQDVPGCAKDIHAHLLDSMDSTIDAYLIFMGDGTESETGAKFRESGEALASFLAGYNFLNPGAFGRVLDDMKVD